MDKTILVDRDIKEGENLLRRLDSKIDIHSALWMYNSEIGQWKLILAIPMLDHKSPRDVYSRILGVLHNNDITDISLNDISAVRVSSPLIQTLRRAIQTGKGIAQIRFSRNTIDNLYIEDAYIYRVQ